MTVAGESRGQSTLSARVWRELGRSMSGPLLLPGDDQFESLRMPAMSRYASPRPQAIARCVSPTDVARVVKFARGLGLETAVRGAGRYDPDDFFHHRQSIPPRPQASQKTIERSKGGPHEADHQRHLRQSGRGDEPHG